MAGPLHGRSPEVARILQAIGSNMGQVRRVLIDIRWDSVVTVHVERFMNDEEADAVADMLEGGTFLRVDDGSPAWVKPGEDTQ